MKYHLLNEAIGLLETLLYKQSDAGGCVRDSLDDSIRDLKRLRKEDLSDVELAVLILEEFGKLFSQLPEIQEQIERLAGL